MTSSPANITGLTDAQVAQARKQYGHNRVAYKKENRIWQMVKSLAKEPMVLLLLAAATIYFISGKTGDAVFLACSIVLVAAISLYQDSRSRNALEKLKTMTQPTCRVIRNGQQQDIQSSGLVVGDSLIVEEGVLVAADGMIVQSNDFSVNESILTGESLAVFKQAAMENPVIFQGTTVASGLAIVTVTAIGAQTKLGQIGASLDSIAEEKTPLEVQITSFVKKMVLAGAVVFLIVWGINYFRSYDILDSMLKALTLAMSILPEEIPVAFTTFMALGAWRLMKMGILVKQMKTVETLGGATIICTDKTGTLTENKMSLAGIYDPVTGNTTATAGSWSDAEKMIIRMAMFASEPIPFDPMEQALHEAYARSTAADERPLYSMKHEYPLDGRPPMMTHIFESRTGQRIIAAKGAPEAIMALSPLTDAEKKAAGTALLAFTTNGYRVLAVGEAQFAGDNFPATQQEFNFRLMGLLAFYDPPKQNIAAVLNSCYQAGMQVKIITGDNAATTAAIARQTGFRGADNSVSGDALMQMNDAQLSVAVQQVNIFSRMFPNAKLKIINALKAQHEIVAMTGDGVNDGPALKAAHIGIAMGKKGTELARAAASLVLVEDDLSKIVDAVAMGRRIYSNLKKAIRYIISIHIPIILTVFIPLALGWIYPNIFSPVHIIFLELIMGPTCSIIYENEPMEANTMQQPPRPFTTTFFKWNELYTSMLQGLAITAGTLGIYQYAVYMDAGEAATRTMIFTTLIAANIFLTLVNRSFYYSVLTTLRYKNNLVLLITGITVGITALLLYLPPLTRFFGFQQLPLSAILRCTATGFAAVLWYEGVKWWKRRKTASEKRLQGGHISE